MKAQPAPMVSGSFIWGEKPATWAHVIRLRDGGISSKLGGTFAPEVFPLSPRGKSAGWMMLLSPAEASAPRNRRRETEHRFFSSASDMSRTLHLNLSQLCHCSIIRCCAGDLHVATRRDATQTLAQLRSWKSGARQSPLPPKSLLAFLLP